MSRRRPAQPKPALRSTAATAAVPPTRVHGGRKWLWRGLIAALLVGGAAWWLVNYFFTALPPMPDLTAVDPKVAEVLRKHREDVARHPRSADAWGWLGAMLWAYDFRGPGAECLTRAEALDSRNPRWPYYHGLSLMIARPTDAIPLFRRAAQLCGTEPEAPRLRLARLLGEQGKWDEAQAELSPLLQAKPDFAPARLLGARAAQARGDLPRALELARSCIQDPRTAKSAWALLTILFREQGDGAAAANAVRRSAASPEDEGLADPFQAEVVFRRPDARALFDQVLPLLTSGRLAEAGPLMDRLVREHPEHPSTWLLLGRLQFLRKDAPAAEKSLRRHLELSPQSAQGLFQLGMTLLAQNRFTEAAEVFRQATVLKPDYGPAHHNRGFALGRAGRMREAAAAFRETLRHNPEHFDAYCLLADSLMQLGEHDSARDVLAQAEALRPGDPRLKALRDRAGAPPK